MFSVLRRWHYSHFQAKSWKSKLFNRRRRLVSASALVLLLSLNLMQVKKH
jgi:hypothetical protein